MWQVAAEHIKSNPIERRIEQHGQQHTVYLHAPCPFPDNLSVMFGEWLYLLRSALDGLMYELVVHDTQLDPPRNARRIYYPINATADNFAQKANTEGLRERTRLAIEATQPYHSTGGHTGSALWWIHELARIDRHRRGHTLTWRIVDMNFYFASDLVDRHSVRICDQFSAIVRDDKELEIVSFCAKGLTKSQSNDGVDIRWRVEFDVPDWLDKIPTSYAQWGMDDRMANAELVVGKTIEYFDEFIQDS
ncbi:hypothetical protein HMPREF3155_11610 [Corynebacterium sp. HMSC06D04]|nr:hypothetical protein HMPREF3155_11610 [Corynebacterium sp. HMSC06D04]OHO69072.1 hypothetical protein HMPREF2692_12240 [Corynebacterium sp. HMSC036D03]